MLTPTLALAYDVALVATLLNVGMTGIAVLPWRDEDLAKVERAARALWGLVWRS